MPTTYINFHAAINPNTVQNLMSAISQKLNVGTAHFYILLSTPGGTVPSGMTVYMLLICSGHRWHKLLKTLAGVEGGALSRQFHILIQGEA